MAKKARKLANKQERKSSPAWSRRNWQSHPLGAVHADNGAMSKQGRARRIEQGLCDYIEMPRGGTKRHLPARRGKETADPPYTPHIEYWSQRR